MVRIALVITLVSAFLCAQAVTIEDYIAVRKEHGITATAPLEALEVLGDGRVIEVSGLVVGSASGGENGASIAIQSEQLGMLMLKTDEIPQWMHLGSVRARILVHASRKDEYSQPHYKLITAIQDEVMKTWEREHPPKTKVKEDEKKLSGNIPSLKSTDPDDNKTQAIQYTENMTNDQVFAIYYDRISKHNRKLTEKEAATITRAILGYSAKYGIDARLVMALVIAESDFDINCTSHKGAMGLGQLMPETARGMGVVNAYDPDENLNASIRLISKHLRNYGALPGQVTWEQIALSLAAYNAGAGAVKKHGGVPPYKETQNYVKRVTSLYRSFCGID